MSDETHCIYINRAMVFDEGVTWTTVAGLYPHAYVPKEHADRLQARAERAEAENAALRAAADGLAGALQRLCDWIEDDCGSDLPCDARTALATYTATKAPPAPAEGGGG